MSETHNQAVALFWTGGWDSTFRLLQLLLLQGRTVQPYYVIDPERASTGLELRSMANLKQYLSAERPQARRRLLPTRFQELSDIPPNPEITAAFKRIYQRSFIGTQYEWLARFCAHAGIRAEICTERGVGPLSTLLRSMVVRKESGDDVCYELDPSRQGSDEYTVFQWFRFPTFDWSKKDMQAVARQQGLEKLLLMTWFCHTPRSNSRPCGVCNPCIYAMQEGMGDRFPLTSRLRYHLRVRARLRGWLRKHPPLYVRVQRLRGKKTFLLE